MKAEGKVGAEFTPDLSSALFLFKPFLSLYLCSPPLLSIILVLTANYQESLIKLYRPSGELHPVAGLEPHACCE